MVDALVAEFLKSALTLKGRPASIVLWRGRFDTQVDDPWPYWSLALEEKRLHPYEALQAAARTLKLDFAMGLSTPDEIGAHPYVLVQGHSVAFFDQRRRPNTPFTITLASQTFETRAVRYLYPAPIEGTSGDDDDELSDLVSSAFALSRRADVRSRSAVAIWERAAEQLIELTKSPVSSKITYSELIELCDLTGITVVELDMPEAGRLVLQPLWGSSAEKVWMEDVRVSIAIRKTLPTAQRRVALTHELGHYTHHLRWLYDMLLFYFRMAHQPELERVIAARWPADWRAHRNRIMELDADYFSATFVVPHFASSSLRDPHSAIDRTTLKGMILRWLHRVFDEGWRLGTEEPRAIEEAWQKEVEGDYDVAASWFTRLARCVAMRNSHALVDMVDQDVQLENEMAVVEEILSGSHEAADAIAAHDGLLLGRCAESEIAAAFAVPNRWDPVIVEPRSGRPATGYLPLQPMFTSGASVDLYDWTRADGQGFGLAGTLEDWWQVAEQGGRGLMLFPMNPVEHTLRRRFSALTSE